MDNLFYFVGEMMMSLLWYYRPEHVEGGRNLEDLPEELFASKHKLVDRKKEMIDMTEGQT